jgi:site-specific DNA-methyltransferase (adenine-specific)
MIDLRLGDCIEILKTLPDNSVDSIVTDPPYHLTSITKRFGKEGSAPAQYGTDGAFARASKGFMGKEWDGGDIAFRTDVWSECYRVLKPGGHLLSFGGSRTYHRMAVAIEDAGFEVRDQIMWIYGSGFPKSHNIGKAIDKIQGNEREVIGDYETSIPQITPWQDVDRFESKNQQTKGNGEWEGWGTALKPAHEPICMARKPLSEKSIAENVLKHGTGGINIDDCRIGFKDENDGWGKRHNQEVTEWKGGRSFTHGEQHLEQNDLGRFPANIMFDEEAGKLLDEQSGVSNSGKNKIRTSDGFNENAYGKGIGIKAGQNNGEYGDKGGASRFFYCPKVSKKERNAGLDSFEDKPSFMKNTSQYRMENGEITGERAQSTQKNHHPTVKPIKLMEYLITLVTPKGGVVLEPFMGSGSTGIAAKNLGMSFIGIEKEQEYFDIAKQRIGE